MNFLIFFTIIAVILVMWANRSLTSERNFYKEKCIRFMTRLSRKDRVTIEQILSPEYQQIKN